MHEKKTFRCQMFYSVRLENCFAIRWQIRSRAIDPIVGRGVVSKAIAELWSQGMLHRSWRLDLRAASPTWMLQ
jgi:hypothetical protein